MPDKSCADGYLVGSPAGFRERYCAWEDSIATGLTINGDDRAIDLMPEITRASKGAGA